MQTYAYRYHAKLWKSVREKTSRPASCQAGSVTQAYVLWASQFHSVSNTGALIYDLGMASVILHCSTVLSCVVLRCLLRLGVVLLYSIHL